MARRWTRSEESQARMMRWEGASWAEIAQEIGRTEAAVIVRLDPNSPEAERIIGGARKRGRSRPRPDPDNLRAGADRPGDRPILWSA